MEGGSADIQSLLLSFQTLSCKLTNEHGRVTLPSLVILTARRVQVDRICLVPSFILLLLTWFVYLNNMSYRVLNHIAVQSQTLAGLHAGRSARLPNVMSDFVLSIKSFCTRCDHILDKTRPRARRAVTVLRIVCQISLLISSGGNVLGAPSSSSLNIAVGRTMVTCRTGACVGGKSELSSKKTSVTSTDLPPKPSSDVHMHLSHR